MLACITTGNGPRDWRMKVDKGVMLMTTYPNIVPMKRLIAPRYIRPACAARSQRLAARHQIRSQIAKPIMTINPIERLSHHFQENGRDESLGKARIGARCLPRVGSILYFARPL